MRIGLKISLLGMVLAACAMSPTDPVTAPAQEAAPLVRVEQTRVVPQTRSEITLSFAPVVKQAAPAVVNIYTRKIVQRRNSPFAGDPFFERFFQDMFPTRRTRQKVENSLGSGVILDPSGIVVSNNHVVGGADEITVILQDRREFQGRVILADEESDLAVLKLEDAHDLPTLEIRDSDSLEVGDLVLAIGNPFGVGQTVTSGIISGLTRSGVARRDGAGVFIQTDAAINPGNSGGALVDMEGRLVGVNTAILSRSGGSNGIGFAIPSNLVARVVTSARSGQKELVRAWFGMDGQTVSGDLAEALGIATPHGILIEDLHPESPIAEAGLRRGDVIVAFAESAVNTLQELEFRANTMQLGGTAALRFIRDGAERSVNVRMLQAPDRPAPDRRELSQRDALPGLTVININPRVIEELDLPVSASGVLVLQARGPASRVGLAGGDIIRRVDGVEIATVDALIRELNQTRGDTVLNIERNGRTGDIRYRRAS